VIKYAAAGAFVALLPKKPTLGTRGAAEVKAGKSMAKRTVLADKENIMMNG
jgi:hypothetical protein